MPRQTLLKLIILPLLIFSCSQKQEEKAPPVKPPAAITPGPPAMPYLKRIQLNSGSKFGTTTNGFKTSVSLGNTSTELTGTTTNGYRVQYNVQDPNSPR